MEYQIELAIAETMRSTHQYQLRTPIGKWVANQVAHAIDAAVKFVHGLRIQHNGEGDHKHITHYLVHNANDSFNHDQPLVPVTITINHHQPLSTDIQYQP